MRPALARLANRDYPAGGRNATPTLQQNKGGTEGDCRMAETVTLHVNGVTHKVEAEPDMPLLYDCSTGA